jgi:thymidylate synthase (FAD)
MAMDRYEKSIELYGDGIGRVDYVSHMGTDLTIVNAARVSFGTHKDKINERDEKLIKYLAVHRHTSTFEHNVVTLRFTVPLFVRSQHHRHRTWSYNEISRRYTDVNIQFYEQPEYRTQHKSNRQASNPSDTIDPLVMYPREMYCAMPASTAFKEHHKNSLTLFERLVEAGVCREQARGVLPQNMYTQYYGTTNLSNLIKFIDLRTHEGAQWEIQKVAQACLSIASELYPLATAAYREAE